MRLTVQSNGEIFGSVNLSTARTDPPMGCGKARFEPFEAYCIVKDLYRQQTLCSGLVGARDESRYAELTATLAHLNIRLVDHKGDVVDVVGFTIMDCQLQLPDEPLALEFWGMSWEDFSRLFPGHYENYDASFRGD